MRAAVDCGLRFLRSEKYRLIAFISDRQYSGCRCVQEDSGSVRSQRRSLQSVAGCSCNSQYSRCPTVPQSSLHTVTVNSNCKAPVTSTTELATSHARLAQVFADCISIILCVCSIIQEFATYSQSQRTVQSMVSAAC